MTDYISVLPVGKENAISSKELAALMGFDTVRALQSDIAKSRAAGQIICSSTIGGYFIPADETELKEFIAVLRARALNTLKAIRDTKRAMKNGMCEQLIRDIDTISNKQLTINEYLRIIDCYNKEESEIKCDAKHNKDTNKND